jgi:integrase
MREHLADTSFEPGRGWAFSIDLLREVLTGQTYEAVAASKGVTRTAVERRIKLVARRLAEVVGIDGLNEEGAVFVRRLRAHQPAVLSALDGLDALDDLSVPPKNGIRILSDDEIAEGAQRIRRRSRQPLEDLALYYILFATAARPLEIARLEVRDYLDEQGQVRRISELREAVTITGRARPLYFHSARFDEAMTDYLADRALQRGGLGVEGQFRGLDPASRLFLSASGRGFEITPYGENGQKRFLCRAIQDAYRRLLRYAGLKQVTALTVRHTVVHRLYARGADESHVGLLLGIAERSTVREQFPRPVPTLDDLTRNLV